MRCADISEVTLQKAVNLSAKRLSSKTVYNSAMLIKCVLEQENGQKYNVSMPQVVVNEHPFLAPSQVPVFLDAIRGTNIELPCLLGLMSLRASEIYALTAESFDFEKRLIRVKGAVVQGPGNEYVRKAANKNSTSTRTVPMPDRVAELLRAGHKPDQVIRDTLYKTINRICEANGLLLIGVHGLRHSYASYALGVLQMPIDIVKEIGGWKDDSVLKRIYQHISEEERLTAENAYLDAMNKMTRANG